jgi:hypothetical protein
MSTIVTGRRNRQPVNEQRDGVAYLNRNVLDNLRRSDIALDKDGVFTRDHRLMHFSRLDGFEKFGATLIKQGREIDGYVYSIDETIGSRLGTVRGYNTGPAPVEAIIAVNKLVKSTKPLYESISFERFRDDPKGAFNHILSLSNSAAVLDGLRAIHLKDVDRTVATEIFTWYHKHRYTHPEMARYMLEVPGSTQAVMELSRHCVSSGKRLSVVTDTPDQDTFYRHMNAVGFNTDMMKELSRGLVVVTAADVKNRKPHPEGLASVKRDGTPLLYIGDTVRDGQTVTSAKKDLEMHDVAFGAVLSGGSKAEALSEHEPVFIAKDIGTAAKKVIRI